jgi:RNA polymerase sigma-B factor
VHQKERTCGAEHRERLTRQYAQTRDPHLRETVVLQHQRLVRSIASRFRDAGEPFEDLVQVANIGLINALDRYDPAQGVRFSTFATPTILGELRRHFRDRTSSIKIPRWLYELHHAARRASLQMIAELGRAPTIGEIAARLGAGEEEVLEALECADAAVNLRSLDTHPVAGSADLSITLHDVVGGEDAALRDFQVYADLRRALQSLESRERDILVMRFVHGLGQRKIAEALGISQMHVSRLQQKALKRLRERLLGERFLDRVKPRGGAAG